MKAPRGENPRQVGTEGLPLFMPTAPRQDNLEAAINAGLVGLARTTAAHKGERDACAAIAWELSGTRPDGITVSDVRSVAAEAGIIFTSVPFWMGSVMKAAGLKPTGEMRRSSLVCTHARPQMVWRRA